MRPIVLLCLGLWLMGCAELRFVPTAAPTLAPTPFMVHADAALSYVLRDIRTAFLQAHPEAQIELRFVERGELSGRLDTAPLEMLITADPTIINELRNQNRLVDAPRVVARNPLAVILARSNPQDISRMEDLNRAGLRVAVAAERTPLGQATRALVENFRHDAAFGPDFPNHFFGGVLAQSSNGAEILQRVIQGQADIGIVYASQAELFRAQVIVLEMPEGLNVTTEYAAVLVNTGSTPARARSFLDFLALPQAQTLWRDYGFEPAK